MKSKKKNDVKPVSDKPWLSHVLDLSKVGRVVSLPGTEQGEVLVKSIDFCWEINPFGADHARIVIELDDANPVPF